MSAPARSLIVGVCAWPGWFYSVVRVGNAHYFEWRHQDSTHVSRRRLAPHRVASVIAELKDLERSEYNMNEEGR